MAYIIYTVVKIEKEKDITALLIFSNHMKKLVVKGFFNPPPQLSGSTTKKSL